MYVLILNKSYGFHKQLEWNRESTETYLYEALSFDILAEYRDTEYEVNRRSRHFFPSFSNRFKPIAEYITANGRHLSRKEFAESSWGRLRCKDKDYYLQDVLGSVVGLTDEHGHQKEEYRYDVWGKEYHEKNGHPYSDIFPTHYGYNGKRFDPKVGLYDYGFRDYKPDINRWTSIDPIRSGNNWYAYVGNDPVNWVDPLGLLPEVPGDGTVFEPDDGLSVAEKDLAASRELARLETLYSELEEADKDFGEAAVGMFVVAQYDRAFDQSIVSTNFAEELREQLISNQRRGEKIRSEINRIFDNSIYKA